MTERVSQLARPTLPRPGDDSTSRLLPLAIAGLCCFLIGVMIGTLAWYSVWLRLKPNAGPEISQNAATSTEGPSPEPSQSTTETVETVAETVPPPPPLPEGAVTVAAGEVVLTGDGKRPVERVWVDQFAIAETEVTNAEYSEFILETGREAPHGWNGPKFPADTGDHPVVNVSWKDAVEFCKWKEGKIGLPVRLPTEAEWELAARGPEGLKFPWGNEWNKEGAVSKESGGKVSAVKKFPINRSAVGAYDMVGNVWEWTSDEIDANEAVSDADVESARKQGRRLRIVKGGSAEESSNDMSSQSRYEVPEGKKLKVIGFRYVVLRKNGN